VHRISLIDIKGLEDFRSSQIANQLANLHSSLGSLLRLALNTENVIADEDVVESQIIEMQNEAAQAMFNADKFSIAFFSKNLLAHCLELLFICSMRFSNSNQYSQEQFESAIDYIVKQFYNAFRLQFICAALFRKNNGSLKGSTFEIMKSLSNIELVLFNKSLSESTDLEDTFTQIQLPLMRKLFAAVYSLKKGIGKQKAQIVVAGEDQGKDILKEICE
jgi:hypothetical protein